MGEGTEERSAEAERRPHAQEENDVGCGSKEDRGSTTGAVGESEGCPEKVRVRTHFGSRRKCKAFRYDFIKIRRTLRTSPAMAAGVTDRLWSVEDLVALSEGYEQRREQRAA